MHVMTVDSFIPLFLIEDIKTTKRYTNGRYLFYIIQQGKSQHIESRSKQALEGPEESV